MSNYWQEAVECALEEAGVKVTPEQLAEIVEAIKTSAECESMCHAPVENPLASEVKDLRAALADQRDKVVCNECGGRGSVTSQGPYHSATSRCWRCNGEGYRNPMARRA